MVLGPWRGLVLAYFRKFKANPRCERFETTAFRGLDLGAFAKEVKEKGLSKEMRVPQSLVDEIVEYSHKYSYACTGQWECDAIRRLHHDPFIVDVVKEYFGGAEPIAHSTCLFWTYPHNHAADYPERFHYDVSDYKGLVVYVYLTGVDENCGAHVAVEGTHIRKTLLQRLNPFMKDEAAQAKYGSRIRVFTGPAGTAFFEDQLCLHKRLIAKQSRLALILNYTLQRPAQSYDVSARQNKMSTVRRAASVSAGGN